MRSRGHNWGVIEPGMNEPAVTVVIRARDEAAGIGHCLDLVAAQRFGNGRAEVIVVDSGSRDQTVEIAHRRGARVLRVPPDAFTFGGALNLGAANAHGEIVVALSAHAFLPDRDWLTRICGPFADPRIACASGQRYRPDGSILDGRTDQDLALARRHPEWGYSNGAGAFRAELWRQRPFRADLPGCEDLEWARHWLERGYQCVIDPTLVVDHDHTHDSLLSIYRRARREAHGLTAFVDAGPYRPMHLARDWWSDVRFYSSPLRARASHRRLARLLGTYAGRRRGGGG
jgi:rhamnosyltransferase